MVSFLSFGFFETAVLCLVIQAVATTTTVKANNDDNNNDDNDGIIEFPSVFTLHIPQSQILTTEVISDLDLLDFDCISNRDRQRQLLNRHKNNNGVDDNNSNNNSEKDDGDDDEDDDPICTVYSLIHSQRELDYIQAKSSTTSRSSSSGLVLEYDAESTETVTKREEKKKKLERGGSGDDDEDDGGGVASKSTSGYSTIDGHSCFVDIKGMEDWLDDFVRSAPSYLDVTLTNIGESYRKSVGRSGYNIQVLKVTAKRSSANTKAPMMVLTGVHAREYAPPEMMRRWMEHIVSAEYTDDIRTMLESTEIHWIPYVNPDGRKLAETTQPWRRKNLNPTGDDDCDSDEYGVDINRNFPMWYRAGSGSSNYGCSQSFHGSGAKSEPETKAVHDYAKSIYPQSQRMPGNDENHFSSSGAAGYDEQTTTGVFLDIHAYGNIYIYPWGYRNRETPNHKSLFAMVSKLNHFTDYGASGPGSGFTYAADGATDDFAFGKLGALAMTWELGDSFHQNCNRFENTIVPDNIEGLTYAASVAYRPYSMAQGPDITSFDVEPPAVDVGEDVQISVRASDRALSGISNSADEQQVQEIRIFIDQHPFSQGNIRTPDLVLDEISSNGRASGTLSTNGVSVGSIQVYAQAVDTDGYAGPLAGFTLTVSGPPPTPSPTTPSPTRLPTPEPTPQVTPDPTPQVTPEPTPQVTPNPTPLPTSEPTPQVTPDPTPQVTPQPTTSNNPQCTEMLLEVHGDGSGEINVVFFDGLGNTIFSQDALDSSSVTTFTENCVNMVDQCSLLRISDDFGDGLINGGKFVIYLDGQVYMERSAFGEGMEIRLGLHCTGIFG